MQNSLHAFLGSLKQFERELDDKVLQAFKMAALEVGTRLIMRSPVDTGNFRNNWMTQLNDAATGRRDDPDPSASAAMAELQQVVGRLTLSDMVTISNNSAYALALEYGHSGQAPVGMVRVTVAEWQYIFEAAARQAGLK